MRINTKKMMSAMNIFVSVFLLIEPFAFKLDLGSHIHDLFKVITIILSFCALVLLYQIVEKLIYKETGKADIVFEKNDAYLLSIAFSFGLAFIILMFVIKNGSVVTYTSLVFFLLLGVHQFIMSSFTCGIYEDQIVLVNKIISLDQVKKVYESKHGLTIELHKMIGGFIIVNPFELRLSEENKEKVLFLLERQIKHA